MRMIIGAFLCLFPLELKAQLTVESIDQAVSSRTQNKAFISELVRSLGNPEEGIQIRERAAWALGQLDIRSSADALLKATAHKGLLIRSAALDSLIRMRARSGLPAFISVASSDPILTLRQKATIGLGLLRWEKAISPLVKLSEDPAPEVRGAAALAMAATHSKKNDFSELLKEMAADANPYVQERARRGLEVVDGKKQIIHEHLKSADSDIRLFGAVYYHHHGSSADLKMLKDAWNVEADDEVRFELDQARRAINKRAAEKKAREEKARQEKARAEKARQEKAEKN